MTDDSIAKETKKERGIRVPTCANISDGPSRMSHSIKKLIPHAKVVQPVFPGNDDSDSFLE